MFEIYVHENFSAAHSLRGYAGDCERKHGHNWTVKVFVQCPELDSIGIGIDFMDVKKALHGIAGTLDHQDLNEIPPFDKENPSSENIAKYVHAKIKDKIKGQNFKISKIDVCESSDAGVIYYPND